MNNKEHYFKRGMSTSDSSSFLTLILYLSLTAFSGLSAQEAALEAHIFAPPLACFGDSNGQLSFSVSGGTPPYLYEWSTLSNPFIFAQGEMLLAAEQLAVGGTLTADEYLLKIEDANGELIQDTFYLENPPLIQITAIDIGSSICGTDCDGFIAMEVGGGTGLLTTSWIDTDFMGPDREALCAGEYVFIISDENGCTQKGILPIEGPTALQIESSIITPTCLGAHNGTIEIEASGGAGEYSYTWSSGQQEASLNDLPAGTYQVSLTDGNGCSTSEAYILPDGPPLSSNLQVNYGCGDGNIVVSTQPINGNAPFNYQWSTGAQSPVLYAMSAGNYSLVMEDADGCTTSEDFTVDFVTPLSVETIVTDVSCFGSADGDISLMITGGQPPFNINWDNGMNGNEISGLNGDEYLFNLSASGCGFAQLVNVVEPNEIMAEVYFTPGENNTLSGTALISGGTAPYILEWSNGSSNSTIHNLLPEETYSLMVTDARQCTNAFEVVARLTAVDELNAGEGLMIAPNPSSDIIWLVSSEVFSGDIPYRLYSNNGQLLRTGHWTNRESLDLSMLSSGTYYLQLWVDQQLVLRKVTKI